MRVGVWEAVIWCMGVRVKTVRMRIVIILVPSRYRINHIINHILHRISVTSIILSNNAYKINTAYLLQRSLEF